MTKASAPRASDSAPPLYPRLGDEALRVENLGADLGGRAVLRDVNLCVHSGELVGLLGPNGAGKTTTLRAILGLIPLREGSVAIRKADERGTWLTSKSARKVAVGQIGYIPQRHEFAWDYPVSVGGAVLSALTSSRRWLTRASVADHVAVGHALERVQLQDLRDRPVGELSGGQRQRVLVARALVLRPSVMLLDEPFTGLDMPSQELLLDLFNDLTTEGKALLMSTHDLVSAVHTCDRLVLLDGTVIASGTREELSDKKIWQKTFHVSENNPLLASVGAK